MHEFISAHSTRPVWKVLVDILPCYKSFLPNYVTSQPARGPWGGYGYGRAFVTCFGKNYCSSGVVRRSLEPVLLLKTRLRFCEMAVFVQAPLTSLEML